MEAIAQQVTEILQPIADGFASLNLPEPITHWGHPLMMGIVIFAMGSAAGYLGWTGRTSAVGDEKAEKLNLHKRISLWMTTFLAMGYSGGILSLIMQGQNIFESTHFWTGSLVLGLLGANGAISMSKFGGGKPELRTVHAYLGSAALLVMVVHAAFGLKLGLSI
ncbi:MAG: DUF4079 domain-containing protein [Cyanobacteria bacterium P01_H01_bin.130]